MILANNSDSHVLTLSKHTIIEKVMMFLFIVSLGLGEVVAVGPFKLSHIMAIGYFFCYLICSGWKIKFTVENKQYNKLLIFIYVWILYAMIQSFWAKDTSLYIAFFRILVINVFIVYCIVTYIECIADWSLILKAFIVMIVISLMVGIWEMITGNHIVALEGERNLLYYLNRPISFYGNGNDYATVLLLGIYALLLYLGNIEKKRVPFLVIAIILIEVIHQIIVIDCRGACYSLYLLIGLLAILVVANRLSTNNPSNEQWINILLTFIAIALLIYIFSNYSPRDLITLYSGPSNYSSDIRRLNMIKTGINALLQSFGFGLGPGQSILVNNINLHFFYLEILVDYGIWIGGYLIILFFKLAYHITYNLGVFENAIIRSFPIVLILLGVASSGMIRLRATWIVFSLLYTLAYNKFTVVEGNANIWII